MSDLAILITAIMTLITALGGGVAWVAARMTGQTSRFDRMEERYNKLSHEYSLVLVKMEKFRLAFQIVASELALGNPTSVALVHARALLADSFVFPSTEQASTPRDMAESLRTMDRPRSKQEEPGP